MASWKTPQTAGQSPPRSFARSAVKIPEIALLSRTFQGDILADSPDFFAQEFNQSSNSEANSSYNSQKINKVIQDGEKLEEFNINKILQNEEEPQRVSQDTDNIRGID